MGLPLAISILCLTQTVYVAMPILPISPCCLEGFIIPGVPAGVIEPASATRSIPTYHARPAQGEPSDNKALILAYDGLGFLSPNTRLLADDFASRLGVHVFIPDYLPTPPPVKLMEPLMDSYPGEYANRPWSQTIKAWLNVIWAIPYLSGMRNSVVGPKLQKAIKELQQEGYTQLGGVGYCLGGAQMMTLIGKGSDTPLKAAVICHPGPCSLNDVKACKIPTSWVMAEVDVFFPPKTADEAEAILERSGLDYEMKRYPGTVHGFAARPNLGHAITKKAFTDANDQTVNWLKKYFVDV